MSKASQIANFSAQIQSAKAERAAYEAKAQEVKKIYEELRTIKGKFVKEKDSLNSKKNESDDSWTGNLHKNEYTTPAENLISDFETSIKAMDTNIDRLHDKINEYENKMFELDGIVGQLSVLLNNISSVVEKWFN